MRITRWKIIVSRWTKKHFKEESLYYHMLLTLLTYDIWFSPRVMANSNNYFSILHVLVSSSVIFKNVISQHFGEPSFKVEISSFIFIFYRPFVSLLFTKLSSFEIWWFFSKFQVHRFFWNWVYIHFGILILSPCP